ncbi:MAG: DUF3108 domain-containing protein [Hyphomicrobiales bacterium]|nr:DUF3108 domain-containing protein [Hyphomicrobiales bacterium]
MHRASMSWLAGCVAAACLTLAIPASAQTPSAGTWQATYGVSLIGLPIGIANVTAALEQQRYKIDLQARLTGLAGMVSGGRGAGQASGGLSDGRPVSGGYSASGSNGKESRTVRMAVSGGTATAVDISPPIVKKPDAIPVAESHRRGITDPVSALLMPVPAGQNPVSAAACNRSIQIFDGNARYDIALSYAGTRNVEGRGYNGPVAVCNARYVPISGHRDGKATQFMAQNRDIQAWLAPVSGTSLVAPYRIAVRSEIGMVVIEATRFEGMVKAADASGEVRTQSASARR